MRPIKFRAWDKKEERMISFEELEERNSVHDFLDEYINPFQEMTSEYRGDRNYQQYTGLKDKNGREIYEKDILKGGFLIDQKIHDCIGLLTFKNYSFIVEVPGCGDEDLIDQRNAETLEVIGNIYEDKHLLEVQA